MKQESFLRDENDFEVALISLYPGEGRGRTILLWTFKFIFSPPLCPSYLGNFHLLRKILPLDK